MSAGSGASNLGYGGHNPYNMSQYVNGTSSNNPANFSSNEVPGLPGLAGAKSNIDAAASNVPGICMKGGAKKLKRKIKNITKYYKKMKGGSKKTKSIKRRLRKMHASRRLARQLAGKRRRGRRTQRGGYSQYQSNVPVSTSYQIAGIHLPASQLALANPAPFKILGGANCYDNYNHYNNTVRSN